MTVPSIPIQLSCYTNNPLGMLQECVFPQMVGAFGGPGLFGLILGGTIISGLWLAGDGDLATPATITVLVGGVLFPILSGDYLNIARVVAFLGLAGVILATIEKYYLEGAQ
jgi:hypothetical protein